MPIFLPSSQVLSRQKTFCSVCGSGLKAREKDAGGCWVMKTARVWVITERISLEVRTIPTTSCAQHYRKQPYAYSLTKKLEKSQAINCSMLGKKSGKLSVYSYLVPVSFPSYLFCSPVREIFLFMFLGCNAAVSILTKPSPFCCPCNRRKDIHTFLPAFSSGCLRSVCLYCKSSFFMVYHLCFGSNYK